ALPWGCLAAVDLAVRAVRGRRLEHTTATRTNGRGSWANLQLSGGKISPLLTNRDTSGTPCPLPRRGNPPGGDPPAPLRQRPPRQPGGGSVPALPERPLGCRAVDDNRDAPHRLCLLLTLWGPRPLPAYDAAAAWEAALAERPDVVLLEVDLPGRDGWEWDLHL